MKNQQDIDKVFSLAGNTANGPDNAVVLYLRQTITAVGRKLYNTTK
jgi:hypothetical protein